MKPFQGRAPRAILRGGGSPCRGLGRQPPGQGLGGKEVLRIKLYNGLGEGELFNVSQVLVKYSGFRKDLYI
jgi:hypothetical protein